MKKIRATFFILLLANFSMGQFNTNGYPFYTYYDSKDYSANDQNWDIIEDKNGLIYVANNNDGILQFDGESWRKIEIENKAEVRAFAMDSNGIIYVGCSNDFGYLLPNIEGKLVFNSLLKRFTYEMPKFSYIFKVNVIKDTVFFSTDNSLLFRYQVNEDTLIFNDLPNYSLFTFAINNKLFGSGYIDGLYTNYSDTVKMINGGDFYKKKNVFSIQGDTTSLKIITGKQGIFNYNNFDGQSSQFLLENDLNYLSEFITYSATKSTNNIMLATIGAGIVSCNAKGKIVNVYDQQIGIKDHVCASIGTFRSSVWCALGFGVTRFEEESPFRYFSNESNLEGYITDVLKFKNDLYVATEIGLFYLKEIKNQAPIFVKIEGINSQIVTVTQMTVENCKEKEFLLIGTIEGIFKLNNKTEKVELIEKNLVNAEEFFNVDLDKLDNQDIPQSFYVTSLYAEENSNRLWISTKFILFCIEYLDNKWHSVSEIYKISGGVNTITKDNDDNIWVSTNQLGLIKIDKKDHNSFKYNSDNGLPFNYSLKLFKTSSGLLCTTPKGIYKYDHLNDKFKIDSLFPDKYKNGFFGVENLIEDNEGNYIINYYSNEIKGIDKLNWNKSIAAYEITNDFKRLGNVNANSFYEDNGKIWFGVSDKLYNYDKNKNINLSSRYKCLVRKVEGLDSCYFYGAFYNETANGFIPSQNQHEHQKPVLTYSYNDITFHYAAPYFEGAEGIVYSYLLDGFKDEWSKWNEEPKAVFTNLNEGHYTFKVKAKNIYDIESEIGTYEFSILPPWYRTIIAYIFYIILIILSIWIIVKLYTRRLKQDKIRLEGIVRERTAEIREQRDEIAEQKHSIESSIVYARRIQRAILPSEELAKEILPEHFILFRPRDIVSGDYFWMNKIGNHTIIIAADCTGHGVPGAFMSMLGVSFLNEIVLKDSIIEPHLILNKLRERVKKTLKQEGKEGEAKDGMDVAVVVFDETKNKLYYAGAYNPAYIFRGNELFELKADRMPIGIYIKEKDSFTLNEFDYQKGDTFYIFSDGYPDQFGGPKKEKLKTKALKEYLESIQNINMEDQKELLNQHIEDWMGSDQEQIDDMVMIGVRL